MKILVFHEKYGDVYYDASTAQKRENAFVFVINQRITDGWYDASDEELAKKFLDKGAAEKFLMIRQDFEYEGFEVVDVLSK